VKQAYRDRLRASVRRNPSEWEARTRKAARRLLSAACFRESAESTLQQAGSALLPPVGFYYALYHGVIATLYLDWRTAPHLLSRARHASVGARLVEHLVKPALVDPACAELFERLRAFRDYANYTVGGKLKGDEQYLDTIEQAGRLYAQTGQAISSLLEFIRRVSEAAPLSPSIVERIAVTIGDDIGDDVVHMYLSRGDADRVFGFLTAEGLST